jgi:hypothetical protein
VTRQVFETQVISTTVGTGTLGIAERQRVNLRIIVNSTDFADYAAGNPPPYVSHDEIQILGQGNLDSDNMPALRASIHFGQGEGDGAGDEEVVAQTLAEVLNDYRAGISAEVDPNNSTHVLVKAEGVIDTLFVRVYTFSYLLLGGAPPFIIQDGDGNIIYDPTVPKNASGVALIKANSFGPMQ